MRQARLSVNLFGPTLFHLNGKPVHLGLKGATRELLWFLVAHEGQEIRREWVADLLWQDSTGCRQRSALNSALWRIGKKLPGDPGLRLHNTDTTLCLTIDAGVPLDTRLLCQLVDEACSAQTLDCCLAGQLGEILAASEAPLMDGLDADWTLAERERIDAIRFRGMIALMHHHGDNREYEKALEIGRQLLRDDPFRESVQIEVMFLYVLNGQRDRAIRQFRDFSDLLRVELAIDPMVETRALYDMICGGMGAKPMAVPDGALRQPNGCEWLHTVMAAAERSRREMYQALRLQIG